MAGRGRGRGPFRRGRRPPLCAVLGVGLALACIHLANGRLQPVLADLAAAQVQGQLLEWLYQAVERSPFPYEQAVRLERDSQGRVTLLQSDMSAVGAYRAYLSGQLLEQVEGLRARTLRIPLGSLSGAALLSGRGPGVPVRLLSLSVVHSEIENQFTAAGINQTRHQIMLRITVDTRLLLPGGTRQIQTTFPLCIAETVIVGEVPEHFIQVDPAALAGRGSP